MSELIQNHNQQQSKLRDIVQQISDGADIKAVKRDFDRLIRDVSPEEIAALEQGLISEGVPVEQVQELCDLHVSVFQNALERQPTGKVLPGHPVHTYRLENKAARRIVKSVLRSVRSIRKAGSAFSTTYEEFKRIKLHYQRKENQLFPYLEAVGFTGPSKVMWGKHDEIRGIMKEVEAASAKATATDAASQSTRSDVAALRRLVGKLAGSVRRMIFMEERILFPASLKKLPESAWAEIRRGEPEIGYAWIQPGNLWDPNVVSARVPPGTTGAATMSAAMPATSTRGTATKEGIGLDVGELLQDQINMMLKSLPIDLTFVDERNKVRYYSGGSERIFPRSPGIIGRDVSNCHPPKSVDVVEGIISAFRKRERESAEFWFTLNERLLHIRYFAVYNEAGNYRGTVEMSQDVTDIRALSGERKLLDWDQ